MMIVNGWSYVYAYPQGNHHWGYEEPSLKHLISDWACKKQSEVEMLCRAVQDFKKDLCPVPLCLVRNWDSQTDSAPRIQKVISWERIRVLFRGEADVWAALEGSVEIVLYKTICIWSGKLCRTGKRCAWGSRNFFFMSPNLKILLKIQDTIQPSFHSPTPPSQNKVRLAIRWCSFPLARSWFWKLIHRGSHLFP